MQAGQEDKGVIAEASRAPTRQMAAPPSDGAIEELVQRHMEQMANLGQVALQFQQYHAQLEQRLVAEKQKTLRTREAVASCEAKLLALQETFDADLARLCELEKRDSEHSAQLSQLVAENSNLRESVEHLKQDVAQLQLIAIKSDSYMDALQTKFESTYGQFRSLVRTVRKIVQQMNPEEPPVDESGLAERLAMLDVVLSDD
jgi:chromosome segregation ATPase